MKRSFKHIFTLMFIFIPSCFAFTISASAYLDPATTSYLIQIVSGIVIAFGVTVGVFWKKIRLFFKKTKIKAMERKYTRQGDKKEKKNINN